MKPISFIALVLFTWGCRESAPHQKEHLNKEKERIAIDLMLTGWHQLAAEADTTYFDYMALDGIYIGTDPGELWTTSEFQKWSEPYFRSGDTWVFNTLERNIYLDDELRYAWFDELLETWMGTCRGSGVVERTEEGWRIKHYHLALTLHNEQMDAFLNIPQDSLIR